MPRARPILTVGRTIFEMRGTAGTRLYSTSHDMRIVVQRT